MIERVEAKEGGYLGQSCMGENVVIAWDLASPSFFFSWEITIFYLWHVWCTTYNDREPNSDTCNGVLYVLYGVLFKLTMRGSLMSPLGL